MLDASLLTSFPGMSDVVAKSGQMESMRLLEGVDAAQAVSRQGLFTFNEESRSGEWTFDPSSIVSDDQDASCERVILRGTLRVKQNAANQEEMLGLNQGLSA